MAGSDQQRYVIAVRRDRRDQMSEPLDDLLSRIDGITVTGSGSPGPVQVVATDAAIEQVRDDLADLVHVEPLIEHHRRSV